MFLSFVWASFSHSSCTPCASSFTLVHIFFSFLPSSWFICLFVTKRGRVYQNVYRSVSSFLYDSCAHSQGGRNSISCTFIGGESNRGDAYTKGEKKFCMRKPCFVCFTLCVFSCLLLVLWVMFSIYALLFSLHRAYVLDMHISLCHCALLVACLNDHLICYIIIVVISIWL